MFTGLVTDLGEVVQIRPRGRGLSIVIRTAYDLAKVQEGDSIACDGVCLTAETFGADTFTITAGRETLDHSTLGTWRVGRKVHLEQAMAVGDRLGGHIVQGHVDGVGRIRSASKQQESLVIWIEAPHQLTRYMVAKGSVCMDGVSLTINEVQGNAFRVNVIPHTASNTHLLDLKAGEKVNLEVDVIARYVERLLQGDRGGMSFERLRNLGY